MTIDGGAGIAHPRARFSRVKKIEELLARAVQVSLGGLEWMFHATLVVILTPTLLAVLVGPGIGVIYACTQWVLSVSGGLAWYPTAFGGLFLGVYLFPISILSGTFGRHLSERVARLHQVRVAEALPHECVAIDAMVVGGRPAQDRQPASAAADVWVTYPLVLQDAASDMLHVERSDGADTPADVNAAPYGMVRVGHRVVAVGEVRRDEPGGGPYRVRARGARLVRGKAPFFTVREGDLASVAAVLHLRETPRGWGIFSLAALALGLGSMIGAQSAAPPWFP
ncbi:hypothetical protein [Polyangium mundeleinium]|uniref:DUF4131 domain-containing protein n=1 Tax=Polyangium mundeleinium TaxID=2995306 RepID=A0ABT5F232_9BACT|nr:hypothetical protein [Polyangium mundeleinium]MDC0748161.1 hypothetical protein [Polyangium mundeleinium]